MRGKKHVTKEEGNEIAGRNDCDQEEEEEEGGGRGDSR